MKYYLFMLAILIESCHSERIIKGDYFLKQMEIGTDSTFKKEYVPNASKSLYSTKTKYYNATIETFVYYQDVDKHVPREIKTFMNNKNYGHNFKFFDNGALENYQYNLGDGHCSYERTYSREGKLIKELGNPFVDVIFDKKGPSTLYFASTFSDSISVEVSTPTQPTSIVLLKKSSMQPMLFEYNINLKDSLYFLKIKTLTSTSKEQIYLDTLNTRLLRS